MTGSPFSKSAGRKSAGYTLVEIGIALGIVSVALLLAFPRWNRASENGELRDTAFALDGALESARSEAIRTGDVQLFFLFEDAEGNSLTDGRGRSVPIAIVNDGAPGSASQNCKIDAGEKMITLEPGEMKMLAQIGAPDAAAAAAAVRGLNVDLGKGDPAAAGSSFADPSGNSSTWLMFRPDGSPVAFDANCNFGTLGSGAGTFYLNNEDRSYAVSVSAMGVVKVMQYDAAHDEWK